MANDRSTPTVVDTLKSEHDLIMLGLAVMESICRRHDQGDSIDPDAFEQLVKFFSEFADRMHHAKEEDILFPAMEHDDLRDEQGLVDALKADHTLGSIFLGAMDDSI
ncbi:MAG: hemerythrin domain-containing protein, partial [candidate division Zixibacteria bacterium]